MNFGGFCDLKMRVTLIWIVLSFVQNAVFFDCPRDSWRWKIKEIDFRCPENKEYHCLLDETNAITEKCIEKTWMEAGSCPKYFSSADKVDVYPCNETKGICPYELYWTNEVFKYNACLPTKSKMNEPATTDLTREPPQSKTNKNVNGSKREGVSAVVIVLPILLACAAMVVIAIILILYKRKRVRNDSSVFIGITEEIEPITPFMDFISTQEEDKNDTDKKTQRIIMTDDELKDGQLPEILTPLAVHTSDGNKVSKDGKFDYSERFESVGKIVEKAGPLLSENGILILVAPSKKMMAEVAQTVAFTCDTQEYPAGFKEFNDSFAEMDESIEITKCVVFNDCFQKGGIPIKILEHKRIFKDLYEKQVASRGRLRFVISFPLLIWNARRCTVSNWQLFNEKYILKFKDLEVRNSKYVAD